MSRRRLDVCWVLSVRKQEYSYAKHKKNSKEKYNKKYTNVKLHVLELNLTVLKHNQCIISVKLKSQEKRYNQKLINRKFLIIQKKYFKENLPSKKL